MPDSVRNSGPVGQTSRQAASAQCLHKSGAIRGPGHLRRRRWRALVEEHGRAGLSRIKDLAEADQREQDSSRSGRWPSPIVLRHYDLPPDEQRDHHRSGWSLYLERLARCLAGGDPGPDPNT